MRQFIRIVLATAAAAALPLAGAPARAHPVHATIGEAVWNADKHALELSIRVRAVDLIEAVGTTESLELASKDPKRVARDDERIVEYLKRRFKVQRPGGEVLQLQWLGKESDVKGKGTHLWLYFWVDVRVDERPLELTNRIFFELDDGQVNTLLFRHGKKESTVACSRLQPTQSLAIPAGWDGRPPAKP